MRGFVLAVGAAAALVVPGIAQTPNPTPAHLDPNAWTVDTAHTAAGFSVKHMLVSTVRGILGPVKGTVEYDGKSLDTLKADITIDVNGVNTGNESRDKDLRSTNFFDVAQFPAATFKSRRAVTDGAGKFKLTGDLTMHGVTREVTLTVEGPSPVLKQANGAQRIGAAATTTMNRKDFGMQWNRMIEAAPVVSDDVQVIIDLELIKQPPATPKP